MNLKLVQTSSLSKIRPDDPMPFDEIHKKTVLSGQRFSYQLCAQSDQQTDVILSVESPLSDHITVYLVKAVPMDLPAREPDLDGEDYITLTPGPMPDLLLPAKEQNFRFVLSPETATFWIKTDIPKDAAPGNYDIRIKFLLDSGETLGESIFTLSVLPCAMPQQRLIYTRWFYADCIAKQHNVEIYSEKHWELIDKYLAAASDVGVNMILVPTHTPPLDTAVGTVRPCVQLVDIEKNGDTYTFDFSKFHRFITLCKNNGIQYYEIAHMFSQWGAKCAPNIMVTENGKTDYLFGWHVPADSPEYLCFLKQYVKAISMELQKEGIAENTYFHISDEPTLENMASYQKAADIFRPLIGSSKTFDALSNYEFYERGLVECPVTSVGHIQEFLTHSIPNQWVYYCCGPEKVFTNCFLSMPSYRTRILGFLLYKYDIKGFLHWGFNFYNSALSLYPINPYLTTSADRHLPSGDPFIVYPGRDAVYPSIRGEVTFEAIQDMNTCFALEKYIGRDRVVEMIDREAGGELKFDHYPRTKEFPEKLREHMIEKIQEYL